MLVLTLAAVVVLAAIVYIPARLIGWIAGTSVNTLIGKNRRR